MYKYMYYRTFSVKQQWCISNVPIIFQIWKTFTLFKTYGNRKNDAEYVNNNEEPHFELLRDLQQYFLLSLNLQGKLDNYPLYPSIQK